MNRYFKYLAGVIKSFMKRQIYSEELGMMVALLKFIPNDSPA